MSANAALVILVADEQGDALLGVHGRREQHRKDNEDEASSN